MMTMTVFQPSDPSQGNFEMIIDEVKVLIVRDELANIENRIFEKKLADKKKEELRKKNIAVS